MSDCRSLRERVQDSRVASAFVSCTYRPFFYTFSFLHHTATRVIYYITYGPQQRFVALVGVQLASDFFTSFDRIDQSVFYRCIRW
jgi:hypothetical protein